jgi:hypothetical protein
MDYLPTFPECCFQVIRWLAAGRALDKRTVYRRGQSRAYVQGSLWGGNRRNY